MLLNPLSMLSSRTAAALLTKLPATAAPLSRVLLQLTHRPATVSANGLRQLASQCSRSSTRINQMSSVAAAAVTQPATDMFCFQCEQTQNQKGCTVVGVCGKNPEVAAIQDVLVQALKGISMYAHRARQLGAQYASPAIDRFFLTCLFSTLTNVNFDADRLVAYLKQAHEIRDQAATLYRKACEETGTTEENLADTPASFLFAVDDRAQLLEQAKPLGIQARKQTLGDDIVSLQELICYGLKGCAAYSDHAAALGHTSDEVFAELHSHMNVLTVPAPTVDLLLKTALGVGSTNLKVMALLDGGHVQRFGHPTPTKVSCRPVPGHSIVVSGHDMPDIEALLQQTEGKGINVYTHGEMLPAHGYPALHKYKHLVGHYGAGWQLQKLEFADFKGAILMTSNCLVEPKKAYAGRIFTRHSVGWPGVPHVTGMDFSEVIECALRVPGFTEEDVEDFPQRYLHVGYARNALITQAGTIVDLVKQGKISRFFVIGGCDGSESERSYFRDLAKATPKDSLILTAGCGKYKINNLPLGELAGLPRVLDCGQCNDSYSAIQVAIALAKAFNTDVNSLPLSFAISWFEQKAVAVLLTLLSLGIKNIRLGPHLPAFVSPNVLKVLVDTFQIKRVDFNNVQADLAKMMQNQ